MAVFSYKALSPGDGAVSGTIAAESPRHARDSLRARGLTIQEVVPARGEGRRALLGVRMRRGERGKVISFVRELSTLLAVGIPLLEALDTIIRQHSGGFRSSLLLLRDRVSAGRSLAEAMGEQPRTFDQLTVSIVEVGENSGTLESVLERLAEFKERSAALKNRVTTALIYPAIVLSMALAVSLFLMTFVVPRLLSGLLEAGRPIPLPTRVVKGASDFLLGWWPVLVIVAGVALTGLSAAARTARGRLAWHRTQLQIPLVGNLIRQQAIARICTVISTLMRSGITFIRAVQIAQNSTQNVVLRDALKRCETATAAGQDISTALDETEAFPPLVVQVFGVGQQSGRLEEMLERLAADYDHHVATAANRLTAALEPAVIVVLVVVVGLIAFATILPILEAADVF